MGGKAPTARGMSLCTPILPDSSKVLIPSFIQCIPNHGTSEKKMRPSNTGQNSQSRNRRVKGPFKPRGLQREGPQPGDPIQTEMPVMFVQRNAESQGDSSLSNGSSEGR